MKRRRHPQQTHPDKPALDLHGPLLALTRASPTTELTSGDLHRPTPEEAVITTRILVPIDEVIPHHPALLTAARYMPHADIHWLHVSAGPLSPGTWKEVTESLAQTNVSSQGQVIHAPSVAEAILTHLNQHPFDLVWMGTTRKGQLQRLRLGSVAARVERDAPIPVVTVPMSAPLPAHDRAPLKVLLMHDFSEPAEAALAVLRAHFGGAQVDLVHVVHPAALSAPLPTPVALSGRMSSLTILEQRNRAWRAEATHRLSLMGGGQVIEGEPGQVALRMLEGGQYALLALGKSSKGWLDRQVFGSTAQHLVRCAPVPVLTAGPRHHTPDPEASRPSSLVARELAATSDQVNRRMRQAWGCRRSVRASPSSRLTGGGPFPLR